MNDEEMKGVYQRQRKAFLNKAYGRIGPAIERDDWWFPPPRSYVRREGISEATYDIYFKPARPIKYITVKMRATPQGVTFDEIFDGEKNAE